MIVNISSNDFYIRCYFSASKDFSVRAFLSTRKENMYQRCLQKSSEISESNIPYWSLNDDAQDLNWERNLFVCFYYYDVVIYVQFFVSHRTRYFQIFCVFPN